MKSFRPIGKQTLLFLKLDYPFTISLFTAMTCKSRTSVIEKEEWKNVMDLVTNAKQVVTSVQDVARKVSDYANFGNKKEVPGNYYLNKRFFLVILCIIRRLNYIPNASLISSFLILIRNLVIQEQPV